MIRRHLTALLVAGFSLGAITTRAAAAPMPQSWLDTLNIPHLVQPVYVVGGQSLAVADPNNAPFLGERSLTVGMTDPQGAGRAVKANCTGTGAVSVTYSDGSTGLWMVQATGTSIFAAEIVQINSSGTTATCTYGNMK